MLYDISGHALLSKKFDGLTDPDTQDAYHQLAELLLGLRAPAYTGAAIDELTTAVVVQINFLLEQDVEPEVLRSVSQAHPGTVTQYRDRYRSARAYEIVSLVTGVKQVRFDIPGRGV